MPKNDYEEKRQFTRVAIETQISFTIDEHDEVSYYGISQNHCARGIYLTTSHAPRLGNHIKIMFNDNGGSCVLAEGKVVRCKFDKKDPNLFHVSVELSETLPFMEQTITDSMVLLANKHG
ncbi:MAG: PilZ domain-containing protein [Pseudomonadota bacterium]|nr:PilZ domain-containing protein [Pseudomonadota bacterium]MDO7667487.1 PilZ domain-containing protein [Pseudomonadota bacterium]MDO7711583.1 PilZ domain-containing protein [Pseudomonadota bacterium]